ncbi:hypothetical protein QIS99_09035 [Streptomyces sp. B-S-A8]|uniref:Uncharacterized protein n=2 Tax=Streptomyces TaxID=1883 RepID=A0ABT6S5A0_9ACTN|nr:MULTISPECIES: hypothetical protein [unclassified Streptomyces]MDI3386358.1 hypothetical protein [Streptomyces sp. B-S-A8]MDI3402491.1 hypothetical protein [Streptomyces sp. B-S-A6]
MSEEIDLAELVAQLDADPPSAAAALPDFEDPATARPEECNWCHEYELVGSHAPACPNRRRG